MLFKQFICRPSLETESSVQHVSTINFVSGETVSEKEWRGREKKRKRERKRERDKESEWVLLSRKVCNKRKSIVIIKKKKKTILIETVHLLLGWINEWEK